MIGLKEYVMNEVSSDLLMKAAKKAKEVGDPRAKKFFDAAMKKMEEEFNKMDVDAQKVAESITKKVFNVLKKLGDPAFGFGQMEINQLFFEKNGRKGILMVHTNSKGILPTKGMYGSGDQLSDFAAQKGLDHVADKLKDTVDDMDDNDPIIFADVMLAKDDKTKGTEIYRNCNYVSVIILGTSKVFLYDRVICGLETTYTPDGKIRPPHLNIKDIEDDDLDNFIRKDILNKVCFELGKK